MKHFLPVIMTTLCLSCSVSACAQEAVEHKGVSPAEVAKPDTALRLFLNTGTKKTYIRGYQWMTLDLNRKISLVESARRGALLMNALMTLPAETYVGEMDKFFRANPSLLQMEVGQVIQGIAISLKDWDNGGTQK